jgi:hypothetical protein
LLFCLHHQASLYENTGGLPFAHLGRQDVFFFNAFCKMQQHH